MAALLSPYEQKTSDDAAWFDVLVLRIGYAWGIDEEDAAWFDVLVLRLP